MKKTEENKEQNSVATEVLKLLKNEYKGFIKKLYGLLIILTIAFIVSIVDSIYQRCRIIKVIEEYDKHCVQEIAEEYEKHYNNNE